MINLKIKAGLLALLLATGMQAQAATWQVSNQESSISYVSTKQGSIAEVGHFTQLKGKLTDKGAFSLTIPLSSIDSGVEIRDTRMKSFLFDVEQYPQASLKAQIDPVWLQTLTVGQVKPLQLNAELSLHGVTHTLPLAVTVAKLSEDKLMVVSSKPAIVNANDFKLVYGINKLRDLAGLSAISYAVPVSFVLSLHL